MPRLLDGETRTDEIVRGICRLIIAEGLEAVTLRNIAREVGISAGSLHHHYESRRRLLRVAAWEFARAFVADNAARRWSEGVVAFLPGSTDDIARTRVWLAFAELGRCSTEIDRQLAEHRLAERHFLGTEAAPLLTDEAMDGMYALAEGLRVAICHRENPLPLERARDVLVRAFDQAGGTA